MFKSGHESYLVIIMDATFGHNEKKIYSI